ncbi:T9SS sorting signal type C domain-containing protein [Flavobacterium terrisoli]|uniref:T9SS sorting signal type C domain-containing protein n=1 Tax=Flavobacterium terrisoli TaxID=3242195 RepID=UPI002543C2C7|nr:T9SS sorting signal type C domain-containing protein [Flavobacterium buctense]
MSNSIQTNLIAGKTLFQKVIFNLGLLFSLLMSNCIWAQPGSMSINQDVSGTYANTGMTLVGGAFRARFQENGSGTSSGTRNWQFNADGYFNQWGTTSGAGIQTLTGFNTVIVPNTGTASANFYTTGYNSNGRLPATQANYYYTYNIIKGSSYASQRMAILETSYNPVTVNSVSQAVGTYGSRTINIVTSGTPATGENIFVRYSTNSFSTSTIVQATGSGTSWSASIPWQSGAVSFYVYTSNRTKTAIDSDVTSLSTQEVHDLSTLNVNSNSGSNYSWTPVTGAFIVTSAAGTFASGIGYSSLTNASGVFSALNTAASGTGAVTILQTADSSSEAGTNSLNASTNWTSITLNPLGARTISGTVAAPMLNISGADNVTFNGLNSGGNTLTISNLSTSNTSGTSTFKFLEGATGNTITNCNVLGSATMANGTNGGIFFFSTDGTTTNGNDNNTISNCNIGPAGSNLPSKAIYGNGSTGTTAINNSGVTISNNNIYDYFGAAVASSGIYLGNGNTDWTISGNKFYQSASRTQTTASLHAAINISNTSSGNNFAITNNTIGYANSSGTGTYGFVSISGSLFYPINLNLSTATATSVQGNTIAGIAFSGAASGTTSSSPFIGIYVAAGLVNIGNTTGNTIGSMSATGSITYTSSSSTASDINGIYNFGSSNWNTSNNNIGGISITNSSTGSVSFFGLRCNTSSSVNWTCNNNTIGGTVANSIDNTSSNTANTINGIVVTAPIATLTGNIIRNMRTAGGTGSGSASSIIGIRIDAAAAQTISQNQIYNLSNINSGGTAVNIIGIRNVSAAATNSFARNLIYNFNVATSAASTVNGISMVGSSGTNTVQNNIIRLGYDTSGTAITGNYTFTGINVGGGTNNCYFNSVYIGGAGVTTGTANTSCFISTASTSHVVNVRNNIFYNGRSNNTGTGKHYAINYVSTPATNTSNYNDYYTDGTGGVLGFLTSDRASLSAWQTATSQDLNSFNGNPQFIDATGTTPDLHIHATNPTVVEGSGINISTITDDYDGQTRSGLTPEDIGADAGNFTSSIVACTTPSTQATGFVSGTNTVNSIAGSFTTASGSPTGYLVIRSSGAFSGTLSDGSNYAAGNTIGNGTVIQSSSSTSFSASSLASNTAYTITIFSYNSGACSGGPKYLSASPLTGTLTTCPVAPTAFVNSGVTSTGATISWTGSAVGGSAATINYTLEVYTNSGYTTPISGSPFSVGSGVSYSLTSLSSITTYYYRVKANNGSCDSAYLTGGTVTTLCGAEAVPTTVQTFATFTGSAPNPVCWSEATGAVANPSTLTSADSEWLNSTGFANTGSNVGVKTNLFNTNPGEWIISNPIDLGSTAGLYRLKYDMAVTSFNGTTVQSTLGTHIVRVIISTDGGATWSSTNTLKTYTGAATYSNTGQTEYINLTSYSGVVKFAFVATTSSSTPDIDFHIDNFGVEVLPACADAPASVSAASAVTNNSASLNWTAAATTPGNSYEYYYSTSNTAPTAGTSASGSVGPTVLTTGISGLSAATTYYFWVRSNCDGTNKSIWTGPGTFVTACSVPNNPSSLVFSSVTATTLNLNFTAASPVPTAYVIFRSTSSMAPAPLNGTTYNSGTSYTFGSDSYTCVANANSTTLSQTGLTANTNYYYYVFSRDNTNSCFGAPWYSTGVSASQITCPAAPTAFVNSAITTTGATISWTASAGGTAATVNYTLEVYTDSGYTTPISGSPFSVGTAVTKTLTGLTAGTVYYYRAKANNGVCDSTYLSSGTVTTVCANATLNIIQGFNSTSMPICWSTAIVPVGGTATVLQAATKISFLASGSGPTTTPQEGSHMVQYNSFSVSGDAGGEERLISVPATTTGFASVDVEFYWRNENNSLYSTGNYLNEGVQIQYSLDGTTWTNAGSFIPRHDGTLASSTAQWNKKTVTIAAAGNQATVYFAFKFHSEFGDNQFLDNVTIKPTPDPITITPSPSATICNGASTSLTASSTAAYTYTWSPATGLSATSGATVTASPTTTTIYTVTGVAGAMTTTQTITVTVNPSPSTVTVTPSSTTVCDSTITTLTASSPSTTTVTIGTSSGSSAAANTPYRQAVTTQARMQYLITKAELNAAGITSATNITSIAFNVTSAGAGTIPTYTIGMANTAATVMTTTFLSPTFTTVYTGTNYVVTSGLNTHTFGTAFSWDGTSNIVVNICMAGVTSGTTATVSVSTPSVVSTATLNGSNSCSTATGNATSTNRPVMTFGVAGNYPITWSPSTGLYTNSGATTGYAGEALSTVYARPSTTTTYIATATLGSCTKTSSTTLTVNTTPVAGTVSSNQSICSGATPSNISLSGSSGNIQWQSSNDNSVFTDISGQTSSTLPDTTIGALTATKYFRAVVSNGVCTPAISGVVTVAVSSTVDFANLQFPATGSICLGGSFTAYGQVYEPGVTPGAGAGAGITVEFGYNATNTDPASWTTWTAASFNSQQGNNDEYSYVFTPGSAGTYYYTFRYKQGACDWQYGGYNGGFWNGSSNINGTLTVSSPPTTAAAGNDLTVCEGVTITLEANTPVIGVGSWSIISGTGGAVAESGNPASNFTGNSNTTYVLRWTISNGTCTASTDDVSITIQRGILDYGNLQTDSATICAGSTFDAYGQVYEPTVTEAAGAGSNIEVQFGYHTADTNPNTWTSWTSTGVSYFGQAGIGSNNDEYKFTGGASLGAGTYYYAFRYRINGCQWAYGGYSATGGGNWNGTTVVNGVLTVTPALSASVSITANSSTTICAGASLSFTATPTNGGTTPSFQWYAGATPVGTNSTTYTSNSLVNGDTVSVVMTSNATPCLVNSPATSNGIAVTVNPLPTIIATADTAVCANKIVTLTATGADSYVWSSDVSNTLYDDANATILYTGANAATVYAKTTVTANFTVTGTNTSTGCTNTDTTTLTVQTVTWNGSWSGTPTASTSAVISSNYTTTESLSACALTVTNNANVIVSPNHTITLDGALTVETGSTFTLESNAVLLQGGATNTNSGAATIKRNSSPLYRLDYTLWTSPVASQNLYGFSPLTLTNRFYTYKESTNVYSTSDWYTNGLALSSTSTFQTGRGYLIRTPNNWVDVSTGTPASYPGSFTGVPNSGDISVSIDKTAGDPDNYGYNAVGNPYPSPIKISTFLTDNSGLIGSTLWFWRKLNNVNQTLPGQATTSYVTYSGGTFSSGAEEYYNIEPGQGFFVKANSAGSLQFKNTQREANNGRFFRTNNQANTIGEGRLWLYLKNNEVEVGNLAIGYKEEATNDLDEAFDGAYINDSPLALTSLVQNKELSVQHRALPFMDTDVVPLSFKTDVAGTFSIVFNTADGVLATQDVYLEDLLLGQIVDIKAAPYSFSSNTGFFADRFRIVYLDNTLGINTPPFNANQIVIYKNGQNDLVIDAGTTMMSEVKIFDINGRLIIERKEINTSETSIPVSLVNEVLLVQITSQEGITVTKKIVK